MGPESNAVITGASSAIGGAIATALPLLALRCVSWDETRHG